ncbi:MAG: ATP-binding protein [Bacillota bacterium]|nr:ATP-binding protein [Bacillota bacterium]
MYNILIVDCSEASRKFLSEFIKANVGICLEIHEAENGLIALDLVRKNDYSLIIMDVFMPIMDGLQTLKEIKADESVKDIPVIIHSSLYNNRIMEEAMEIGACDFYYRLLSDLDTIKFPLRIKTEIKQFQLRKMQKIVYEESIREMKIRSDLLLENMEEAIIKRGSFEKNVEAEARKADQLLKLSNLNKSTTQSEIYYLAVKAAIEITESGCGVFCLYDDSKQKFSLDVCLNNETIYCIDKSWSKACKIAENPLWRQCLDKKNTIIIDKYDYEDTNENSCVNCSFKFENILIIPIFDDNEVVAVLAAANRNKPFNTYDESRLKHLMQVVWQIKKRNEAETEKDILLKKLEERTKEMEDLLYAASHDLRTPLVNIQGFSGRLEKLFGELADNIKCLEKHDDQKDYRKEINCLIEEKIPRCLHYINASSIKMNILIKGILSLSRTFSAVFETKTININDLIRSILDIMEFNLQTTNSKVFVENLPDCKGDYLYISQVFANLLDNALKYRDENRPLEVTIKGKVLGDKVLYEIRDNGIGMPLNHLEEIWKIFFRCITKTGISGEGLGLTITKKIIERSNGSISVESTEGEGSCFYLELPAAICENSLVCV